MWQQRIYLQRPKLKDPPTPYPKNRKLNKQNRLLLMKSIIGQTIVSIPFWLQEKFLRGYFILFFLQQTFNLTMPYCTSSHGPFLTLDQQEALLGFTRISKVKWYIDCICHPQVYLCWLNIQANNKNPLDWFQKFCFLTGSCFLGINNSYILSHWGHFSKSIIPIFSVQSVNFVALKIHEMKYRLEKP